MQLFNKLSDFPSIDELETSFFWYAAVRNGSDNTIILVKTCFSTLSNLQCLLFIIDCNSFWALSYARNKYSLRFRSTLALNVSELILFLRDNGREVYYVRDCNILDRRNRVLLMLYLRSNDEGKRV